MTKEKESCETELNCRSKDICFSNKLQSSALPTELSQECYGGYRYISKYGKIDSLVLNLQVSMIQ